MNRDKYKKILFVASFVAVSFASFVIGVYANETKTFSIPLPKSNIAQAATKDNTDLDLFFSVWNTLREKSIHYNEVKDEDRIYGAIQGLTASLGDPYTVFMTPKEAKDFNESISGSFDGIGAELGKKDGVLTIIAPLKNSPSEKAGLKSGDKIVKIEGKPATDISIDEAVSLIRGKKGTIVKLEIYRDGDKDTRVIEVMRDTIVVPTIESELVDGVYVIHIYNFGDNVVRDFENSLKKFKESGSKYLILDLRGNPGGYLESAVDIGSYFIPKGKTIVSEDFVLNKKKNVHTSYGYRDLPTGTKVVVLADGGSASASEILAGALRDNKIAKIVGVKTFGKGSVQELMKMKGGTNLKVTVAKWLTPAGDAIDKNGIKPDFEVKLAIDEKNPKKDNQLEKAISVVKSN